jgi:1-acyl-sn-glycerol-3-phosphate acyltransferase
MQLPGYPARAWASPESLHGGLENAQTLLEVLDWHVHKHPDRLHVRVLATGDAMLEQSLTYSQLRREASALATGLWSQDVQPGESIGLMLPTCREFFVAFIGILLAGGVPVPIYPPFRPSQLAEYLHRQARILDNARATVLITIPAAHRVARAMCAHVGSIRRVATVNQLAKTDGIETSSLVVAPGDTALLQYTSGSTAHPKGVVLSHENLLANIRALGLAADIMPSDVFVSWLPLYHDMGLIGAWLGSLYHGCGLVVMSPIAFLAHPASWLTAIDRYRGTLSAAPNFAFEHCVRRIQDSQIEGLDLRSWRWAFDGAEPVSPAILERFCERFAPYGFATEALAPAYGLAEASVGLTLPPPARGPRIDRINREVFARSGQAEPTSTTDPHALRFASCGRVIPGHQLRIVDRTGREVAERHEGRVEFSGPSATSGYFRDPQATAALFDGTWLDSGDLGYLADGELYVTGRVKDMIVRAGRNVHPDEIEETIGDLPGVCTGGVAVFASSDPTTTAERLIVLAETRETTAAARAALSRQISARAAEFAAVAPDQIILVPPDAVRKTSSGKIARGANRDLYERGAMSERPPPAWRQLLRFQWTGIGLGVRRSWRWLRSIAYNAAMWLLLIGIGTLVWPIVLILPGRSRRLALVRRAARLLIHASGCTLAVSGIERLPPDRPIVVVANHASFLDGLALTGALPLDLTFVAAQEFSAKLIVGPFLRAIGTVFVERTRIQGLVNAQHFQDVVEHGRSLAVFPEGSLSLASGLRPFHLGSFVTAARASLPVVPVAIRGTRSILRPGQRRVRRGDITVVIGDPISPTGNDWHAAVELQRVARAAVLKHCGEPERTTR